MRIFSSGSILLARGPADILQHSFCRHFARPGFLFSSLLAATMNQKSSLREVLQFVSEALTANIVNASLARQGTAMFI
jgi:hypothetical protein